MSITPLTLAGGQVRIAGTVDAGTLVVYIKSWLPGTPDQLVKTFVDSISVEIRKEYAFTDVPRRLMGSR
jgi:hypothetical protein